MREIEDNALPNPASPKYFHPDEDDTAARIPDASADEAPAQNKRHFSSNKHSISFAVYLLRAVPLVLILTIVGKFAPLFPSVIFPAILLLYAIPATLGPMYNVVAKRLFRQENYTPTGTLSNRNRRWTLWMAILFSLALFSALAFVLKSPSWSDSEWLLIWAAAILFYPIFQLIQHLSKKEYSPKLDKAKALTLSIIVTTIALCIAYALTSAGSSLGVQADFKETLPGRFMPFEQSSCTVLSELNKASTYADFLTQYGLSYIASSSYIVAFVIQIVLSASIFFGIVGQFGACLITRQEIKSEFQLLPSKHDEESEGRIRRRYVAVVAGIWIIASIAFLCVEYEWSKTRTSQSYTEIDQTLDEITGWIVLATDHSAEELTDMVENEEGIQAIKDDYESERDRFIEKNESTLKEEIEIYYQNCSNNTDAYLDWYYGIQGGFARFVKFLGKDMAADQFNSLVVNPIDSSSLENEYGNYISGLKSEYDEYRSAVVEYDPNRADMATVEERFADVAGMPNLWPLWNSDAHDSIVEETLLASGSNIDRDSLKTMITEYIEAEKTALLNSVDYATEKLK